MKIDQIGDTRIRRIGTTMSVESWRCREPVKDVDYLQISIFAPGAAQGDAPVGAGCLVAEDLIITKATDPASDQASYSAALPNTEHAKDRYSCTVSATVQDEVTGLNASLLKISDPDWVTPPGFLPPSWGTFTGGTQWTSGIVRTGETSQPVEVNAHSRRRAFRWDLRLAGEPAEGTAELSGAPLYVGELLTALAFPGPSDGPQDAWTAVPVAALASREEFRGPIEARTGQSLHLAPIELTGLVTLWSPAAPPRIAADLLDPSRAVTPFMGQRPILDQLAGWCRGGASLAGRLLVGRSGQGKTRLARQLAQGLHNDGWLVGEASKINPTRSWLDHLTHTDRPALLIFDGMEEGAPTARAIAEHIARHAPAHPVRLLLLARHAGAWWSQWCGELDEAKFAFAMQPTAVPDLSAATKKLGDAGLAGTCVLAFAHRLEHLSHAEDPVAAATAATKHLDTVRVHAVSGQAEEGCPLTTELAVLGTMLMGEHPRGETAAQDAVIADAVHRWGQAASKLAANARTHWSAAVDLSLLCEPVDQEQAVGLLGHLPGLDRPSAEPVRTALAQWIRGLRPPRDPARYWGQLLPSRLRDRRLAVACGQPEFRATLLGLKGDEIAQAFTHLAEATSCGEAPATLLADLIDSAPARFGPGAIAAALRTETAGPLIEALRSTAERDDLAPDVCTALMNVLPVPAGALAEIAVALRQRLVAEHRKASAAGHRHAPSLLAGELVELSDALAHVGQPADALAAAEAAVTLYGELRATASAVAVAPGLRAALRTLATRHLERGEQSHAAETAKKAVELCEEVTLASPEHGAWLAIELTFLADLLLDDGRPSVAADAYRQAATVYDNLRRDEPRTLLDQHAEVLCGLSDALDACNAPGKAAEAMESAVRLYETLADADPRGYLYPLAATLEVLAERLGRANHSGEAARAAEHAVTLYRRLAERHQRTELPDYAEALRRLADRYAEAGRHQDALNAAYQSVDRYRSLARAGGVTVSAELSAALYTLALRYRDVDQPDYAADAAVEAAHGYRRLVEQGHAEYRPALAAALSNAAVMRGAQGRLRESEPLAQQAVQEAVTLDAHHDLERAAARNNLAIVLGELARRDGREQLITDSVEAARDAVDILDHRPMTEPESHVKALITLARQLGAARLLEEGVVSGERAADLSAGTDAEPAAGNRILAADALRTLAERYADADRWDEAAATAERAREEYRRLGQDYSGQLLADLAHVSALQARMPTQPANLASAIAAAQEATRCYAELSSWDPAGYLDRHVSALEHWAALCHEAGDDEQANGLVQTAIGAGASLMQTDPRRHTAGQAARFRQLAELAVSTDLEAAVAAAEEAFSLSQRVRDPRLTRLELAVSALLLSRLLSKKWQPDDARSMTLADTAVSNYEATDRSDLYLGDYAAALLHRARLHARARDSGRAAIDAGSAVGHYQALVDNGQPAHRPALAEALRAWASYVPDKESATRKALYTEAVQNYEILCGEDRETPERYLPGLAWTLLDLAKDLYSRGKKSRVESLRRSREAVDALATLARHQPADFARKAVRALLEHAGRLTENNREMEAQGIRAEAEQINQLIGGDQADPGHPR